MILWQKFEDLRPIIGIIMFQLSPLLLLIMLLVDHIERLSGALDSLKGKFDFFENLLPGGIGQASLLDIGKSVFGGGGAEAAATGGGVAPQQANWQTILAGGGMGTIEPAPVIIDGRQLAEVVFKHRGDRMARR